MSSEQIEQLFDTTNPASFGYAIMQ